MSSLFKKIEKPSPVTISSIILIFIGFSSILMLLIWNNNTPVDNEKKIFFVDNISSSHQHVIDRFNQIHKGEIKVEVINLSFEKFSTNERKELLARYLRSKNDKIDIFSADQIWAHRFARWAEPLDKYFNDKDKKTILNTALQACLYKDQLVAVPFFMDIGIMFYRKDLLQKLPDYQNIEKELKESITWENFIKLGAKFKNKSAPFYTFQADNYEGLMCSYIELLEDQNKSLFENGKIQLTSPESERALNLLVDLVNKYHISPSNVSEFKENNSYRYYIQNDGMFIRAWPNFPRDYTSIFGKEPKISEVVKVPIPHFAGFKPVAITGGWNLMISKYSKQIPEALEFVKYLMGEEAQKIMYEEGGFLPTNNEIYNDTSYTSKYPDLKFFKNYLQNGIHRPYLVDYTRISDVITHFLQMAIKKEISVKSALQRAQDLINNEKFNIN
jgi:multiple sugar transport system substrate-binding protein